MMGKAAICLIVGWIILGAVAIGAIVVVH